VHLKQKPVETLDCQSTDCPTVYGVAYLRWSLKHASTGFTTRGRGCNTTGGGMFSDFRRSTNSLVLGFSWFHFAQFKNVHNYDRTEQYIMKNNKSDMKIIFNTEVLGAAIYTEWCWGSNYSNTTTVFTLLAISLSRTIIVLFYKYLEPTTHLY